MKMLDLSAEYVAMLQSSMARPEARTFALSRLEVTLSSIGIDPLCRRDILQLLMMLVRDRQISKQELGTAMADFGRRWRTHLDRAYLRDYESTRWEFFRKFVFGKLPGTLGRCLDIGCGRGCVTASVVHQGVATEAVGIDEADFGNEWRERLAEYPSNLRFQHVAITDIGKWTLSNGKFDTILLFYVLHHSCDYWSARTLDSISSALKENGRLVILEDSLVEGMPAAEDGHQLCKQWATWMSASPSYILSVGYDVQVILDFVAVQLLARFSAVQMPCNYKTSKAWVEQFDRLGYEVSAVENIGFPAGRDIDVPQGLFILKQRRS